MARVKNYVLKRGKLYMRVCWTDETGKRRQTWKKAESKSAAKDMALDLRADLDRVGPEALEHSGTSFDVYLTRWLRDAVKGRVTERTHQDYADTLTRYVRPVLGKRTLGSLKPTHIQALYTSLRERGLSARTVRYVHAILHSALKQATRWNALTRNPSDLVELPKQTRREMKVLTPEQARTFITAARSEPHGLVLAFAVLSGMRPEEYLGLKWSDLILDSEEPSATVQRVVIFKRPSGWEFGEPKTKRSRRTVPFPANLIEWFREHKRTQAEQRLHVGPEWNDFNLVFCASNGSPLSLRNLERRHFTPLLKRLDIPRLPLYSLRHSCASLMLVNGENAKVVSERLGHASVTLTLDTYSAVLPGLQRQATERLGDLLFAAGDR